MSILGLFANCFPSRTKPEYSALAKKDENFSIEEAKNWVKAHPIDHIQEIRYSTVKKINKYVNDLVKSLTKSVPITSSNVEILTSHMVEMAKKVTYLTNY